MFLKHMQMIVLFLLVHTKIIQAQNIQTIHVGLMFVKDVSANSRAIGYRTSAAAVLVAQDRIKEEHLLDNYNFNFSIEFDECSETLAAGAVVHLVNDHNVDVIIGPTCNSAGIAAASLTGFYKIPIFQWGLTTSASLSNFTRFPTTVTLSVDTYNIAMAVLAVMDQFEWTEFVFVYSNDGGDEKCTSMKDDMERMSSEDNDVTLSYIYRITTITMDSMGKALRAAATKGRIIISCFPGGMGYKKAFVASAYKEGLATDEFVYIVAEPKSRGFYIEQDDGDVHYSWEDTTGHMESGMSEDQIRKGFSRVLFIVDNMGMPAVRTEQFNNFSSEVISRMAEMPFNCTDDCKNSTYQTMSTYAGQLFDSLYSYALALNQTLQQNRTFDIKDGAAIMRNIGMKFRGVGGEDVVIDSTGTRQSKIIMYALNSSLLPFIAAEINVADQDTKYIANYQDESELWRGRSRPLSTPICGFSGKECPPDFLKDNLVYSIIVVCILLVAVVAGFGGVVYTMRMKQQEAVKLDLLWQIPTVSLRQVEKKSKAEASLHSFASGPSASTKVTVESRSETTHFIFFVYQQNLVAGMKHETRPVFDLTLRHQMRQLRNLDNDNLNKFIGLCLDGTQMLSIWRYCSRGSLADVISRSSMQMDYFFMFSLISDVCNGLSFIHNSFLKLHGNLTSRCCLIDDRWQIKLSDYGLNKLGSNGNISKKSLLWTAPEYLRNENTERKPEGDVYSLGIICSEVVTRTCAYDVENDDEKADTIIHQVKKGGFNPTRPSLVLDETVEVNPSMIHMIRDCWTERPSERLSIQQVKSLMSQMSDGRKGNLMDHVFNMLETYTSTLEEEVSERTKELVEEKKKSDILLYRMLPKTVAEKLKLGQTVEPETFEQVTIFFSDVVSFTKLAAKCSPLQVVTLLNDLYTVFDGIIEQHDVYKVETIGDGYLCVSGLPHRNGNEHCRHIARMALGFLSSLQFFRIPHLPGERINLRIGINCGSVVAGVVGLTMPRFCLFGDAVNTASRMESNGKPGQIHISSEVNDFLVRVVGGFITESRGEVIIKGKGVMETFWLLGENEKQYNTNVPSIMKEKEVPHKSEVPRSIPITHDKSNGLYSQFRKNQDAT